MSTAAAVKRCGPTISVLVAGLLSVTSCSSAVDGNPVSAPPAAPATTTTSTAAPAPGADLQAVVLPAEDIRRIMNDPTLVKVATWRHPGVGLSITFTPPQCAVVAATGMHAALDGSGFTVMYSVNYISTAAPMVQASLGAAGFADSAAVQGFIAAQRAVWQQCADIDMQLKIGDQTGAQHNGPLQANGNTLTMKFTLGPGSQCVHTLAAKNTVVIDNLVCSADPSDASTAILNGMVDKVPN